MAQTEADLDDCPMTWAPPPPTDRVSAPPTSPPSPASSAAPPDERAPWPIASWLSLIGSALVALAALIVGFTGRNTLGALGPAGGLLVASGITWIAGRRLIGSAPTVGRVLDHLARLEAAVTVTALVPVFAPWPTVVAVFGLTIGAASVRWQLGGHWSRTTMRAVAIGALLVAVAAQTGAPLGLLLGAVAAALSVLGGSQLRSSRTARRLRSAADTSVLLAGAAMLAPLGGWPGRYRIGPGTLARLGVRGAELGWAAPVGAALAAVAMVAWAYRTRTPVVVLLAVSGFAANALVAGSAADWPRWTTAIWLAAGFASLQAACAASAGPHRRALLPAARWAAIAGGPALIIGSSAVAIVTVLDGRSGLAAIAPMLSAIGYAITPVGPRVGWTRVLAALATCVAAFAATGSVTAVAALAAAALAVVAFRGGIRGDWRALVAAGAWVLVALTQFVDPGVVADGVALIVLALIVYGIGRRAPGEAVWLVLAAAYASSQLSQLGHADADPMTAGIVWTGVAGIALVAWRRTTVVGASAGTLALGALAVVPAVSATFPIADARHAAMSVAIAALLGATIAMIGWIEGQRSALHIVAVTGVAAVVAASIASGVPIQWVSGLALAFGVASAGATFSRPVAGPADTVAIAALVASFVAGVAQPADSSTGTFAWSAMTALGIVIALHGLCRLDGLVTRIGCGMAAVSLARLAILTDAGGWLWHHGRALGMSRADLSVALSSMALAVAGALIVLARRRAGRAPVGSWLTAGPATILASGYLLTTIATSTEPTVRVLVSFTLAIVAVAIGALVRSPAVFVVGVVTTIGAVVLTSWSTLVALPTWTWVAAGGATLLTIAAAVERRSPRRR